MPQENHSNHPPHTKVTAELAVTPSLRIIPTDTVRSDLAAVLLGNKCSSQEYN
jgi:hypothetical protein